MIAQRPLPVAASPDWILAIASPLGYWCRRCDARIVYDAPVAIRRYLDDARSFQATHRACPPAAT